MSDPHIPTALLSVQSLSRLHVRASFELNSGECIALQGASGSGKTVLMRAIADLANWDSAQPLIEELHLSADCGRWKVGRLSTGEKQRLGLARALMLHSRVLLLDEPTSGLDSKSMAAVESIVAKRRSSSTGVIWCTHDKGQAKRVASRLLVAEHGRIEEHAF
jgi:UDP-glucose/iron transport system ATP-binding protein